MSENYNKKIENYLLQTLDKNSNKKNIYIKLAELFRETKEYQASCESFLFIYNLEYFKKVEATKENREAFYEELSNNQYQSALEFDDLANRAEALGVWSVVVYVLEQSLHYAQEINLDTYVQLAYARMQLKEYEVASTIFMERKKLEEHIANKNMSMYEIYRTSLFIDDKTILYNGNNEVMIKALKILEKDVFFDNYKHILVVEDMEGFNRDNIRKDILLLTKESHAYGYYLAQAKYILTTDMMPSYFKRKAEQAVVLLSENKSLGNENITHQLLFEELEEELIQEVFFNNSKNEYIVDEKHPYYTLYNEAKELFEKKEWKSSFEKFLTIVNSCNDIKDRLPTRYFLKECEVQLLAKKDKKRVEELLTYRNYHFSSENFVGVLSLLEEAVGKNKNEWRKVLKSFLPLLEVFKNIDQLAIRSISNSETVSKIDNFSVTITDELDATMLPYQVWFLFADLFLLAQKYQKYFLARTKARESVLAIEKPSTLSLKRYKINALSEVSNQKEYALLRDEVLKKDLAYIKKHFQLLGLNELYFNKRDACKVFSEQFFNEDEKSFANYIKGKSVALVGPVDSKLGLGEEIDSHDVVIRFNYNGLNSSLHKNHGSKTDVSFYITEILIRNKFNATKIENMNQIDWAIYDTMHSKNNICFLGFTGQLRKRHLVAHSHCNPYFKGTANAIQRVLLDILRFDIKSMKVYNTNLFLENSYHENYKSRGTLGAKHLILHWHDPLSNFVFLKRLKEFNMIDTDEILAKILTMSESDYIDGLEERYGTK